MRRAKKRGVILYFVIENGRPVISESGNAVGYGMRSQAVMSTGQCHQTVRRCELKMLRDR